MLKLLVEGNTVKDLALKMRELADELYPPTKTKIKVSAPVVEDDEDEDDEEETVEEDDDDSAEEDEADEEDSEDEEDDDAEEEEAPKSSKKSKPRSKKLTPDDVNDACKALAKSIGGKEGRKKVVAILKKKFKVESITDLEPEQYQAVITAMKA